MSDTNIVILSGKVSKAPEMRYTSAQKAVTGMSISVTEEWNGGKRDEFVRVIGWGDMATTLSEVQMGDYVLVTGKWSSRSWDKDGVKQRATEVNCRSITVLTGNGIPNNRFQGGGVPVTEADLSRNRRGMAAT